MQELGIVPCASYVELLLVVAQEEGQDIAPVVDHGLVGRYAIVDLAVAAAADTAGDENNYKAEEWRRRLCSFRKVLPMEELLS